MKIYLLACLAFGAIEKSISCDDNAVEFNCEVKNGNTLVTAAREEILVPLPCKYNAIHETYCGKYKITVTPGNEYDTELGMYVMKSIWVGVEDRQHDVEWKGMSTVCKARKYRDGELTEPFVKEDGYLQTTDVFSSDYGTDPDYVTLREKNDAFKIDFRLDSDGFKFSCSGGGQDYPTQICGEQDGFAPAPNVTTLLTNIFAMEGLIQSDCACQPAARALERCEMNDISMYSAIEKCGPILSDSSFYTTIAKDNAYNIISAFRHCAEFVCSEYEDLDSCFALKEELSESPKLPEVSDKFEEVCDEPLYLGK